MIEPFEGVALFHVRASTLGTPSGERGSSGLVFVSCVCVSRESCATVTEQYTVPYPSCLKLLFLEKHEILFNSHVLAYTYVYIHLFS